MEMSAFVDLGLEVLLGSEPPNKTVSRELPGEEKRWDMQVEIKQRTFGKLKQIIARYRELVVEVSNEGWARETVVSLSYVLRLIIYCSDAPNSRYATEKASVNQISKLIEK